MMELEKRRALCSAAVWGSGQLINGHYVKAALFFTLQLLVISIELGSGYYLEFLLGQIEGEFRWGIYGGFFGRGFWGLITLGENPRVVADSGVVEGDHSIILLIRGVYTLIVFMVFALLYAANIRDAYRSAGALRRRETGFRGLNRRLGRILEAQYPYFVSTPAVLGVMVFVLIPIIFSFLVAFTNYNIYNIPPRKLVDWVGFRNFADIFRIPIWSSTFLGVFSWNIIFAVVLTLGTTAIGLVQAVIINNRGIIVPRFWRSILMLPWAVPGIISLLVFRVLFNGQFGPVNSYLLNLGIIAERIPWFSDPGYARFMIFFVSFWLGFPYWMVLCSGILSGIDQSINEAAAIDGANSRQLFFYITLPQVLIAVAPLLGLTFAGNFNNFGLIYFLTDGGPSNVNYQIAGHTDILISWIYKLTLDQRIYNMAGVMSILIFLIIAPLVALGIRRTKSFRGEDIN